MRIISVENDMAWLSYLKVLTVAVIAPQLVSLFLWLNGFEVSYVRIAFTASALGLFIIFASVISLGFIELFGRYAHVSLRTMIANICIIYFWSSALPFAVSLSALSVSKNIKPSFQAANGLDVVWIMLTASLVLHALALTLVLLLRGWKKKPRAL